MGRPKKSTDELVSRSLRLPSLLNARIETDRGEQSATDWIIEAIREKLDGPGISLDIQPTRYLPQTTNPDAVGFGMPPMPAPPKFGLDAAAFLAKLKPTAPLIDNLPLDEPEDDPQEKWYHKCRDQFPQQTKQAELQSKQFKGKDQWGRMTWEQRYERLQAFRDAGDSGQA